MSKVRYIAQRLDGAGGGTFLHWDLPITDAVTTEVLSGPCEMTGTIPAAFKYLQADDGKPLLQEWSTAIWAEVDDEIRGGGILVNVGINDQQLDLDVAGFAAYPSGMPYTDIYYGIEVDPLNCFRLIWDHLQSQPGGNLGLTIDPLTCDVRIGTEETLAEFTTGLGEPVSFYYGPFKLVWWQTDDLGREIDDLVNETPFQYRERHYWEGNEIRHHIDLGQPRLGRRRTDLRFVVGENVVNSPKVTHDGDLFANGVIVLGAGQGRDRVRSPEITRPDGRLRRVATVVDNGIYLGTKATKQARLELAARSSAATFDEIVVRDTDTTPIGSWMVGDEILIQSRGSWGSNEVWCRIMASSTSPEDASVATLSVERSDMVVA